MKRALLITVLAALVLLQGCGEVLVCSSPNILYKGKCCLDLDNDGKCDSSDKQDSSVAQKVAEEREEETFGDIEEPEEQQEIISAIPVGDEDDKYVIQLEETPKYSVDDDPFKGNENAKAVLILFSDYQSASTQRFYKEVLPLLLDEYGDKLKYVFRDYPDHANKNSKLAAIAANCALEQGKFWEYHDKLFRSIRPITKTDLKQFARDLGLDMGKFESCLETLKYNDEVENDVKDASAYSISIIPTFLLGNEKIVGFRSFEVLSEKLYTILRAEIEEEKGRTIAASSANNKAFLVLEDVAALDRAITRSPYSDKIEPVEATFRVTALDKTKKDSKDSLDQAELTVEFKIRNVQPLALTKYKVVLKNLLKVAEKGSYLGGVGSNVYINGGSGTITNLLPKSIAYLVIFGKSDVYKNDKVIASNRLTYFFVTQGIRDENNHLLTKVENDDIEAYLIMPGEYGLDQEIPEVQGGFIHIGWQDINLKQL